MKFYTCKKDLKTDSVNLTKGKLYKKESEDELYYWIITDGNNSNIPFYLTKFAKKEQFIPPTAFSFDSFFYNLKEERKLKIEKIKKLDANL